jgi:hypothetical protein
MKAQHGTHVYERVGKCNQCGDCCREETLPARIRAYKAAGINFTIVNQDCDKFDLATGRCLDYDNRPESCKQFPILPADIVALPRCSFRFRLARSPYLTINQITQPLPFSLGVITWSARKKNQKAPMKKKTGRTRNRQLWPPPHIPFF